MPVVKPSAGCKQHPTDFWCPWCERVIDYECAYDHADEHMDKAPYAVDIVARIRSIQESHELSDFEGSEK